MKFEDRRSSEGERESFSGKRSPSPPAALLPMPVTPRQLSPQNHGQNSSTQRLSRYRPPVFARSCRIVTGTACGRFRSAPLSLPKPFLPVPDGLPGTRACSLMPVSRLFGGLFFTKGRGNLFEESPSPRTPLSLPKTFCQVMPSGVTRSSFPFRTSPGRFVLAEEDPACPSSPSFCSPDAVTDQAARLWSVSPTAAFM